MEDKKNEHSQHILAVSATMMGFCLISLTTAEDIHIKNPIIIDVLVSIALLLFTLSTTFSFLSFREIVRHVLWETLADYIFILGILFVGMSTVYIVINLI